MRHAVPGRFLLLRTRPVDADESPVRAHHESLASSLARGTDTDTDTGPCMQAAPCGGAVPTTPAPIVRIVDTAALLDGLSPPAIGPGREPGTFPPRIAFRKSHPPVLKSLPSASTWPDLDLAH